MSEDIGVDDSTYYGELEPLPPRTGPRIAYCPVTGYPYVTARPGERKITSEEIKELLEDFP